MLKIMGLDPGTAITGYGLVSYSAGRFHINEYGAIRTDPKMDLANRLGIIYRQLTNIMGTFCPDHFAIEQLFFNKNTKTALAVGHARGVAMLAAVQSGVPVFEYTPLQVKQAVAGHGRAAKDQVQFMVKSLLCMGEEKLSPDDIADALAVAVCHAFRWSGLEALKR